MLAPADSRRQALWLLVTRPSYRPLPSERCVCSVAERGPAIGPAAEIAPLANLPWEDSLRRWDPGV
jgi:hypothetical protein